MSNFMSYEQLSPSYRAFLSQLSHVEIPKSVQDALNNPKWKEVILEKIRALEKNQTWEVLNLPKEKTIVGYKWVFTMKYNSNVSI